MVRLLGTVEVVVDGSVRSVAGIRRKAILAALALNTGKAISVDRLVDMVWNGNAPSTAVSTLQSNISYLRREFALRGRIVARAPGYLLDLRDETTDVQHAERLIQQARRADDPEAAAELLRSALRLWRGGSLEDLAELPAFVLPADQLDGLRWTARRLLAEAKLASGEDASAVQDLISLVGHFTLDEDLHWYLMTALYRTGRQGDALATYRKLRRRLKQELGIRPLGSTTSTSPYSATILPCRRQTRSG
jgi:DNA-binding SARP family transcriptional activator